MPDLIPHRIYIERRKAGRVEEATFYATKSEMEKIAKLLDYLYTSCGFSLNVVELVCPPEVKPSDGS